MVERWCCAGKCANPDPGDPRDMLGPLDLKTIGVRDVGIYTCLQQNCYEIVTSVTKRHRIQCDR